MSIADELREERRAAEIVELALTGMIVEFGISSDEAARLLIRQANKPLKKAIENGIA